MSTDPFSQIYSALWEALEARQTFKDLVKPGNRIKFDDRRKLRGQLQAADLPLVALVADAIDPHLFRTSNGSSFKRRFRFEIYTDDVVITDQAFPVEWELIRAVAAMGDVLTGLAFVKSVRAVQGSAPGPDPDGRSNGWHTAIAVDVEIWLDTAGLQN